jgi:hypothetical protein
MTYKSFIISHDEWELQCPNGESILCVFFFVIRIFSFDFISKEMEKNQMLWIESSEF